MQKVTGKNGQRTTVFNSYEIGNANSCPECSRTFKPENVKFLEVNGFLRCPKCNARLTR